MRRVLASLAALILLALSAGPATAGKPTQFVNDEQFTDCSGSGEGITVFFGGFGSSQFGTGAYLDVWTTGSPETDPPSHTFLPAVVDSSPGSFHAEGDLVLFETDTSVGSASFDIALTPAGPQVPFQNRDRFGNRWFSSSGWTQELGADPSLTLPDGFPEVTELGCFAQRSHVEERASNPNSFIFRGTQLQGGCELIGDDLFLFVGFFDEAGRTHHISVDAVGPAIEAGGSARFRLGRPIDTSIALMDFATGDPAGAAVVEATMIAVDTIDWVLRHGTGYNAVRSTLWELDGTVEVAGQILSLDGCQALGRDVKEHSHEPKGPKATGPAPSNDLPAGASSIAIGGSANATTRAAAVDAEQPFECLPPEDAPQHTVWYRVTGTGGPITIETAGSDYDTVVAVYESAGLVPVPDGCVDDVFFESFDPEARTLQSSVTFASESGVVYLVQVGGFPDLQSYGKLKVAVS
jgi:hypothetical protein